MGVYVDKLYDRVFIHCITCQNFLLVRVLRDVSSNRSFHAVCTTGPLYRKEVLFLTLS